MVWKIDVKKLRKEHGMSQGDLAKRLDISRPTLVKIEGNRRKLTKVEEEKIQEIFGIAREHSDLQSDVRVSIPQKKLEKFKQVFLYVLEKTAGKPNVGMTVLYKLLYFIDFDYYEKYEEQLMGLTYIKNHHGPTPREFVSVVDEMKKTGELEEVKSAYFTYEQRKFLPHCHANLSELSAQETAMIDNVLARYAEKSATELSTLSHEDTPWIAAEDGKNIEYDHVFYRPEKLSVRQYDEL
ncbi:MAG: DUF4065 domain-containing protein [bacterium]|nr:DUF4065 domain-containing protein [bacterium]